MDTAKKALFFTLGAAVAVCVVIFAFLLRPGEISDAPGVPHAATSTEGTQAKGSQAGVTVDRNGRCHDARNGQFVKCPW